MEPCRDTVAKARITKLIVSTTLFKIHTNPHKSIFVQRFSSASLNIYDPPVIVIYITV